MSTGFISYPNLIAPKRLIATRTWGLRPDTAVVWAIPQATSPQSVGNLSFGFRNETITWTDALLDKSMLTVSTRGHLQLFRFYDRRWKLAKHIITGVYNLRQPDGSIDPDTIKPLPELISILFQEMDATCDVSAIPAIDFPEVIWDRAICVDEAEELLNARGFVPVLLTNNTYKIYVVGTGAVLPANTDVASVSVSIDPHEPPETLIAVTGKTRVQSKLKMAAVGLDTDGRWKKVNDLSYKPATGWENKELTHFAYIDDEDARQLAIQTVGKCYMVDSQADGTHNIAGGSVDYSSEIEIESADQYLPLSDKLLESGIDIFGKEQEKPAYIEATFFEDHGNPSPSENYPEFSRVDSHSWELNKEHGIVIFTQLMRKRDNFGNMTFADVYLTCSYSVTDSTNLKDRYERERSMGGYGTEAIRIPEIKRTLICQYGSDNTSISDITDNEEVIAAIADILLTAASAKYLTTAGNVIVYRGIYEFDIDGVNQQIVWECPGHDRAIPFRTICSQNLESQPNLTTRDTRRRARAIYRNNREDERRHSDYSRDKKG